MVTGILQGEMNVIGVKLNEKKLKVLLPIEIMVMIITREVKLKIKIEKILEEIKKITIFKEKREIGYFNTYNFFFLQNFLYKIFFLFSLFAYNYLFKKECDKCHNINFAKR